MPKLGVYLLCGGGGTGCLNLPLPILFNPGPRPIFVASCLFAFSPIAKYIKCNVAEFLITISPASRTRPAPFSPGALPPVSPSPLFSWGPAPCPSLPPFLLGSCPLSLPPPFSPGVLPPVPPSPLFSWGPAPYPSLPPFLLGSCPLSLPPPFLLGSCPLSLPPPFSPGVLPPVPPTLLFSWDPAHCPSPLF